MSEKRIFPNGFTQNQSPYTWELIYLLAVLDLKTHETEEHSRRVRNKAVAIGQEMGITDGRLEQLSSAAFLHDIGKISVSEYILNKPGELTRKEWEIMKRHVQWGYNATSVTSDFAHISKFILYHHEWWDGSGYFGIKGESIPLFSRIIAISDSYDAMTSHRPYSPCMSEEDTLAELKGKSGKQFDPQLVELFVNLESV